jgi:Probable cobalt transporter subunit (CbtB)
MQGPPSRPSRTGRPGKSGDPGARRLAFRPHGSDRGEDPEKEVSVESNSLGRRISLGEMPLWSWLLALLFLVMLFALLSASGDLLVPLLGQTAGVADYLHEFAHDGRHLLAVPCH